MVGATGEGDTLPRLPSVCPDCGVVFHRDESSKAASCPDCIDTTGSDNSTYLSRTQTRQQRGYDSAWDRLSKRARKLQPFCSDCGREDDLTADHSPEAWRRKEQGKTIRLKDIDVVCRRCNSERGAARGEKSVNYWNNRAAAADWFD